MQKKRKKTLFRVRHAESDLGLLLGEFAVTNCQLWKILSLSRSWLLATAILQHSSDDETLAIEKTILVCICVYMRRFAVFIVISNYREHRYTDARMGLT